MFNLVESFFYPLAVSERALSASPSVSSPQLAPNDPLTNSTKFTHPQLIHSTGLKIDSWNARSLSDKYAFVVQTLLGGQLDVLTVTESWQQSEEDVAIQNSLSDVEDPLRSHLLPETQGLKIEAAAELDQP